MSLENIFNPKFVAIVIVSRQNSKLGYEIHNSRDKINTKFNGYDYDIAYDLTKREK
jgi:hypothetical protein